MACFCAEKRTPLHSDDSLEAEALRLLEAKAATLRLQIQQRKNKNWKQNVG
jgi:hypothetical protein